LFIVRGKSRVKENTIHIHGCRCNEGLNTKRRDLNVSYTLGSVGRNNSKLSIGSSGHTGGTRSGQTWKKPEDLSTREGEECGGGGGGGCMMCVCELVSRIGTTGIVYYETINRNLNRRLVLSVIIKR
jgi:hypothetical protein